MSSRHVLVAVAVAVSVATACEGSVRDPIGDPYAGPGDITVARVDYRTSELRLRLRLEATAPPTQYRSGWYVSVDGDGVEDWQVTVYPENPSVDGGSGWEVARVGTPLPVVPCSGVVPGGGWDGTRIRLDVPTSCIAEANGSVPSSIRIAGWTNAQRSGGDSTAWTAPIVIS
jgi:hypothetical protein